MIRTQIQFTTEQLATLKAKSAREEVSVSELVRQAVDLLTATEAMVSPEQLRKRAAAVAGRFASGSRDGARNHDDYLAEAFET